MKIPKTMKMIVAAVDNARAHTPATARIADWAN